MSRSAHCSALQIHEDFSEVVPAFAARDVAALDPFPEGTRGDAQTVVTEGSGLLVQGE